MTIKALLGLTILLCFTAWTADTFHPLDVKTGLWETTLHSQASGAPLIPPEVLNRLPAEQRAKIEERMKAQIGQGPHTTVTRSCITKEKLNQPMDLGKEEKSCMRTIVTSSSSKQEVHFECTNAGVKTSGTVRIEALSSENIKATTQLTSGDSTRTSNIAMDFTAKWLGPVCSEKDEK